MTNAFGIAIQTAQAIITSKFVPIELSCVIVYDIISFIELLLWIYTIIYIGERQSALFNLRNSAIDIKNQREKIKTSHEIEQELYYKFPYLKKAKNNNIRNTLHNKDE